MEKLCNRWSETGQWSRLNSEKSLFVEPRGGNQDDFELTLKGYYDSIHHGKKPTLGRKRRIKKIDLNHFHVVDSPENSKKGGAALLGVCRGKVSEGIDFSDDNARVVIIVGIPFPNINDIQVALKKKYNDTYKSSKNLLSGNEWYCHQAFRALNQAAGRCIRHRLDYGAIILLDERLQEERNRPFISKWVRRTLRVYDSFDLALEGLKSFFEDAKERYGMNAVNDTQNLGLNGDVVQNKDQNKRFTRKKNQKLNKSGNKGELEISASKDDGSFPEPSGQDLAGSHPSAQGSSNTYNCNEYNNMRCCNQTEPSFAGSLPVTITHEEISIVKETPCVDGGSGPGSPGCSRDDNSDSTIIEASAEFPDHLSRLPMPLTNGSKNYSRAQSSITVTPEKSITANNFHVPEMESSMNLSVNSHTQKRRKPMFKPFINLIEQENYIAPCASTLTMSADVREATHGTEYGFDGDLKSNSPLLPTSNLAGSCSLHVPLLDQTLQIFCSLCKNPLGRPENHLHITCSLISSSKVHLRSLLKQRLKAYTTDTLKSVPVIITDSSYVHQCICNRTHKSAPERGVWCPEDGCVFSTIFCPFCSNTNNLLGVQIMATNSSNIQLIDKILFYFDSLEVKNHEESGNRPSEEVDLLPVSDSGMDEVAVLNSIDKFSYLPQLEKSEVSKSLENQRPEFSKD